MLWILARKDANCLMIPKAELDTVPEEAELLSWYEPLYESWMLMGICQPAGPQARIESDPVRKSDDLKA